jgi:HEAT repeat protein
VRDGATLALGRIGSKEAVAALAELLAHEEPRMRMGAAQALRVAGARAEAAVPALAKALKDKNRGVSGTAAEALESIGPGAKAAVPALAAALKFKESHDGVVVRIIAAKALGKIGPAAKDAAPALVQAVKFVNFQTRSFTTEDIELLAAIEAKLLGPELAQKMTARLKGRTQANAIWNAYEDLFDSLGNARAAAAGALKLVNPEAARAMVPELIEMLKDKDAVMRYCGAGALGYLGPDAQPAVPVLVEALKDGDTRVRIAAADALRIIDAQAAQKAGLK